MTDEELRQELKDLHDQIKAVLHKEPLDRDVLGHIMTDVVRLAQGQDIGEGEVESLKERLEDKAADFESRHPRAAGVLRDIMEVLAKLGI